MKNIVMKYENGEFTLFRSYCTEEEAVECAKAFNAQEPNYPKVYYFAHYGEDLAVDEEEDE